MTNRFADLIAPRGGLEQVIHDAIAGEVRRQAEVAIEAARADVEKAVRSAVAQIVLNVASQYELARDERGLTIRVKIDGGQS